MNYGDYDDLPPRKIKRRSTPAEDDDDDRPRARSRRSRDDGVTMMRTIGRDADARSDAGSGRAMVPG